MQSFYLEVFISFKLAAHHQDIVEIFGVYEGPDMNMVTAYHENGDAEKLSLPPEVKQSGHQG